MVVVVVVGGGGGGCRGGGGQTTSLSRATEESKEAGRKAAADIERLDDMYQKQLKLAELYQVCWCLVAPSCSTESGNRHVLMPRGVQAAEREAESRVQEREGECRRR